MKLKQQPEDFLVDELTDVTPSGGGFALYRLEKVGWTTADAVQMIRRVWKLDLQRVSYGGLKDRHARTTQHLTIRDGKRQNFSQERVSLTYLGDVPEPFTAEHIRANRFGVVMRSLAPSAVEPVLANARTIGQVGVPNYFDDQRFGSVPPDGRFVALEMIRGRFEEALKLALAGEYEHDRAADKREKQTLLTHWGSWTECQAALPRGHARSLVDYLRTHPTDFKGAAVRLRPDLQGLYLSAYQSHVWNRLLAQWLRGRVPAERLADVRLKLGRFPIPLVSDGLTGWQSQTLPLPSARLKPPPDAEWLPLLEAVLAEDGLSLSEMKIRGVDRPYFSKGDRPVAVVPANLTCESHADERNRGRTAVTLRFELPRGAYATMVVKCLTTELMV